MRVFIVTCLVFAITSDSSLLAQPMDLLQRYCLDCHGQDAAEAGVDLSGDLSQLSLLQHRKTWLRALQQLESETMPPDDSEQPTDGERKQLIQWLDQNLRHVDWGEYSRPGRQSLARVTSIEYRNRVRDALGVDVHAGVYLGRDPEGATGFTNDRDNSAFPLFAMQDYLREAERAIDAVLGFGKPKWSTSYVLAELWQQSSDKSASLSGDGQAVVAEDDKKPFHISLTTPQAGKYEFDIEVALEKLGPGGGVSVLANGREVGRFVVNHASRKTHRVYAVLPQGFSTISLVYSPEVKPDYGDVPVPPELETRIRRQAPLPHFPLPKRFEGDSDAEKSFRRFNQALVKYECDRRISKYLIETNQAEYNRNSFLNFRRNSAPFNLPAGKISVLLGIPQQKLEKQLRDELGFDRNDQRKAAAEYKKAMAATRPELVKPDPGKVLMYSMAVDSHALEPADQNPVWVISEPHNEIGAANVLRRLGQRAFRRVPSEQQISSLLSIYEQTRRETGSHESGLRDAMIGALISPEFLLTYLGQADNRTEELDSRDLVNRLATFLWLSIPDDYLRQRAEKNLYADPTQLNADLDHLILDDRFDAFCQAFVEQWLDLDAIKGISPTLVDAMRKEPAYLLRQIVREDRSVLELLDADFTWLNEPLAEHYGIAGVKGLEMRPVNVKDHPRGGLLAMAGILAVTSTQQRTSPVARGAWIVETLLGTELPPPPASVPELKPNRKVRTIREELEQHRRAPQCAGCHAKIDPYGFVLEHYNRFGIWRDKEGLNPVDSKTVLDDGTEVDGLDEFKVYLRQKRSQDFARNLIERMLKFALGRETQYYDQKLIRKLLSQLESDGWKAKTLIRGIVQSEAFRKQDNRIQEMP